MTMSPASSKALLRILVVDDHPIVRLGVRQMIAAEPDLSISFEAETAESALEFVKHSKADLAIVDLSLGTGNGLELIGDLHRVDPDLPVLVLSIHDEVLFAERALRAGARGYIMKREAINSLVEAIREVLAGRIYTSPFVSHQMVERVGRDAPGPRGRLGGLSDRELQVFELIGRGLSTAEIAERLDVSVKTIETYRFNIKSKLDLKDANDLVRYAVSWTERL
jgi:DNA-binding NarL/FixJ family response regulator